MFDYTKNTLILGSLLLALVGCSKIDDFVLGKDNSVAPKPLAPVHFKENLKEKWSTSTGFSKKNTTHLKLKPAIMDKKIFTADAGGVISAVNTKDGTLLWSKKLSDGIISGPTVAHGYLVVGTESSKIAVLSTASGQELWQASLSGDSLAKQLIVDNKVVAKTIDGNLYAFDLQSGKQLWLSQHGAPSMILKASSSPVAINNKMLLVGYSDGKLDAIDIQTGQILWQKNIAYAGGASEVERLVDIDADPIVQGNTVFLAGFQGYVGSLSLSTGEYIWKKPASTYKNILVKENALYMTDSQDVVWSINKQTGEVNWKQKALKARGLTEPSILGNRLIVGDRTGILHVLSLQNGEFLARKQLAAAVNIAPKVSGKSLYVIADNGKLSRFSVSG